MLFLHASKSKKNDDKLVNLLRRLNVDYFRGDEVDVLARMYKCVEKSNAKTIVRITSDCPLLDYRLLDRMIKYFHENPHKIKEMGNYGYKTAQKSSSWDNYGDRWQAFLNELIIKNKEIK